jgi:predicted AlkP superfamily pyrophosphatase or phosphodiesterase
MQRRQLLACLVGFLATGFAAASAAAPRHKVLIIGIDGCRFDAIEAANTPNLDRLMEEGCFDPDCQILGTRYQGNDTISGPGWSSILTGVWADKHGVQNNTFRGRNYENFPHFFARLKEVQPQAFTASVVTWLPIQNYIVSAADVALKFAPQKGDYSPADVEAAKAVTKILSEQDPTVVFYYIGQVDANGHAHGFHPTVAEYVQAIERADAHVGEVLNALRNRKTYAEEAWLILVTSDHGGKGTGHSKGHQVPEVRNSFVIVSGPAARRGRLPEETYLVDVPVTALYYLGVEPKAQWQLDGRPIGLKEFAPAAR